MGRGRVQGSIDLVLHLNDIGDARVELADVAGDSHAGEGLHSDRIIALLPLLLNRLVVIILRLLHSHTDIVVNEIIELCLLLAV